MYFLSDSEGSITLPAPGAHCDLPENITSLEPLAASDGVTVSLSEGKAAVRFTGTLQYAFCRLA